MLTNHYGLPDALVRAVQNDPYDAGTSDITVTKLIDAPQRRVLWRAHAASIDEDVSDRIWALLGQAVHHILERAETGAEVETRLFAQVDGWVLSGQFDRLQLSHNLLQDYKVTTTYKQRGSDSWTQQLNILRWLAHANGYEVDRLEIVGIFRDWRKTEVSRKADYPPAPVGIIEVPVWSLEETGEYIRERIALHKAAEAGADVRCTPEERWYSGSSYALMKVGGKRALKVADTAEELGTPAEGQVIVERPGEYRRCANFCEVAAFCPQWGEELAAREATDAEQG